MYFNKGLGQEVYQLSQGHFVRQENKAGIQDFTVTSEGLSRQLAIEALIGQSGNVLGMMNVS